jgi:hypothetical protein
MLLWRRGPLTHTTTHPHRPMVAGQRRTSPTELVTLTHHLARHSRPRNVELYKPGHHDGVYLSLVAHLVRDEGVAGSNPATPTNT